MVEDTTVLNNSNPAHREKLFAVYVGGNLAGAHLEMHDLRFAVSATIEDCYAALRQQWWGTPESLHLDAWGPLTWADGYRIGLARRAETGAAHPAADADHAGLRLFLVHLGGYDPDQFTECHENLFIVAPDQRTAKARALSKIDGWISPHRDATVDIDARIDAALDISGILSDTWSITLTPDDNEQRFRFETRYVPIGKAG